MARAEIYEFAAPLPSASLRIGVGFVYEVLDVAEGDAERFGCLLEGE